MVDINIKSLGYESKLYGDVKKGELIVISVVIEKYNYYNTMKRLLLFLLIIISCRTTFAKSFLANLNFKNIDNATTLVTNLSQNPSGQNLNGFGISLFADMATEDLLVQFILSEDDFNNLSPGDTIPLIYLSTTPELGIIPIEVGLVNTSFNITQRADMKKIKKEGVVKTVTQYIQYEPSPLNEEEFGSFTIIQNNENILEANFVINYGKFIASYYNVIIQYDRGITSQYIVRSDKTKNILLRKDLKISGTCVVDKTE